VRERGPKRERASDHFTKKKKEADRERKRERDLLEGRSIIGASERAFLRPLARELRSLLILGPFPGQFRRPILSLLLVLFEGYTLQKSGTSVEGLGSRV